MIAVYIRTLADEWSELQKQVDTTMRSLISEETLNACMFTMYVDFGYSATNESRPAYSELLNDMSSGLVSELVVTNMDRLSRSIAAYEEIIHIARENDIEIITIL